MIYKVFTVYDSKTEAYLQPFYMKTNGEAIRAFTVSANNPEHQFCTHAVDFTLFEVGSFDDSKCSFSLLDAPRSLGNSLEFKE